MSRQDEIRSLIREAKELSRLLWDAGVDPRPFPVGPAHEFVQGWTLFRGDYPTRKDQDVRRNPIYMGGSWGYWHVFLGVDGIVYEHQFRGTDTWNGRDVITETWDEVQRKPIAALLGPRGDGARYRDRFAELRRSTQGQ